ncbi:capsular polysaccharide synthesis protein [Robbsia sp. KACC 23696]|uniref:capsular polysaccharide synthesis protein n=1 Tax=Robbsia sp. KACC 23696 TaxID=3149231 RepID=UPI00325AEE7D
MSTAQPPQPPSARVAGATTVNTPASAASAQTVPLLLWSSERDNAPPRAPRPIPPLFWTYWDDAALPLVVRACLTSWRDHHPEARITVLRPDALPADMASPPPGFARWTPQVQSDWVRLAVLARFGGVWMDASTVLHAPLHFIDVLAARHQPDLIGYYNRERTQDAAFPMLENWFLAAPRESAFIRHWFATFDRILQAEGQADVAALVSDDLPLNALLQGFSYAADYFACHAAAQYALRQAVGHADVDVAADANTHADHRADYRLALMPAELDAFLEAHSRGWAPERVSAWLCETTEGRQPVAARLTKLIGLLWRPLEARLQRGEVHPASIIGQLLR